MQVTCEAGFHPCFKSRKKTKMLWYLFNTSINSNHHSASLISGTTGLIIKSIHSCKILNFILVNGRGVVSLYIILNFLRIHWLQHTQVVENAILINSILRNAVFFKRHTQLFTCFFLLASILSRNLYHSSYMTFKQCSTRKYPSLLPYEQM